MALDTVIGVVAPFAADFIRRKLGGSRRSSRAADLLREEIGQGFTGSRGIDPGVTTGAIQSQGFPPGTKMEVDPVTGEVTILKRRRRRKRLLTCQDKADIAFIVGTLGKGSLASTAISSLMSRRC